MSRFGLLGERLSHSFSPLIHAELGDYEYNLYEKKPDELENFLRNGDFDGLNVTVPYKKTVIPFCGGLSETARNTGSVNTLTRLAAGSLYGDNTDYFGFSYLLKKTGVSPADGKVLVLGSGGSSLTVQAVLRDMNAKKVVVVSRRGEDNYGNIHKHSDAIMLINTTPVGMYPDNWASPQGDLTFFKRCRAVIDLIYNPFRTSLLLRAEELGILRAGGLTMLVAQAKQAAEIFLRASIPDGQIEVIASKIGKLTRNIVLIGMPGCGKTSIGAVLAKLTDREFADTDEWIADTAGKSIPAIFAEDGEDAFRKLETEALRALCKGSGMVVATGGGIVRRPQNRDIIRQNGFIIFLDRAVGQLPLSGRPLSEKEGVKALAKERLPLYSQWSDHTAMVHGVEQTAEDICELFFRGGMA